MGAYPKHDQPFTACVKRSIFVRSGHIWFVFVTVISINQFINLNSASCFYFAFGTAANKNWLALPKNCDLGARLDIGYIHSD
jgi:hypothetical protein